MLELSKSLQDSWIQSKYWEKISLISKCISISLKIMQKIAILVRKFFAFWPKCKSFIFTLWHKCCHLRALNHWRSYTFLRHFFLELVKKWKIINFLKIFAFKVTCQILFIPFVGHMCRLAAENKKTQPLIVQKMVIFCFGFFFFLSYTLLSFWSQCRSMVYTGWYIGNQTSKQKKVDYWNLFFYMYVYLTDIFYFIFLV